MKPDLTNYEIWIVDYLDGRLNEYQISLFEEFLDANPGIREEMKLMSEFILKPENQIFRNKYLLHKKTADLPEFQFELLCIGDLEGDLSSEQKTELKEITDHNPEKFQTLQLFHKLKLRPPEGIRYSNPGKLRKKSHTAKILNMISIATGAAAAIFLLVYISSPILHRSDKNTLIAPLSGTAENLENTFTAPEQITPAVASISKSAVTGNIPDLAQLENLTGYGENNPDFTDRISGENETPERTIIHPAGYISSIPQLYKTPPDIYRPVQIQTTFIHADMGNPGLKSRLTTFIREKILGIEKKSDEEIKAYEIAEAGINGINKLLGWQMAFSGNVDESGELEAISFSSKLVKFNIPVRKNYADE